MGLSNIARVPVHRNANYKADGTKSLVWLFHKYGMTPTRQGRFHRNKEHVLMKRQTDGSSAQVYVSRRFMQNSLADLWQYHR